MDPSGVKKLAMSIYYTQNELSSSISLFGITSHLPDLTAIRYATYYDME